MCTSSVNMGEQKRAVLFPQGNLTQAQDKDMAAQMLIFCGADPMRFIDHAYPNLDEDAAFEKYIKYIRRLDKATLENAITLLINTENVPYGILKPRQVLQQQIPALARALWCVYVDPQRDPFVFNNLASVGKLYGKARKQMVFMDYRKNLYLLLRSDLDDFELLRDYTAKMLGSNRPETDRDAPTSPHLMSARPPSARDMEPQTPSSSQTIEKPLPPFRTKPAITETTYRFRSQFPVKRKLGSE